MLTSIKAVKGMDDNIKQSIKAADDLYSTAVSRVRQPIEAMFAWLIEKTYIQRASKGLIVYAFCILSAAFFNYTFNP